MYHKHPQVNATAASSTPPQKPDLIPLKAKWNKFAPLGSKELSRPLNPPMNYYRQRRNKHKYEHNSFVLHRYIYISRKNNGKKSEGEKRGTPIKRKWECWRKTCKLQAHSHSKTHKLFVTLCVEVIRNSYISTPQTLLIER